MIQLMLADSNRQSLERLSTYLAAQAGIEVAAAVRDGASLIRALEARSADVVVTDLALSVLDGLEVMRRMGFIPPEKRPHIIALTGFPGDQLVSAAMRMGASYVMAKPCDEALLCKRITGFNAPAQSKERSLNRSMGYAGLLLRGQGISGASLGNRFIYAAIETALTLDAPAPRVAKHIYPEVARYFGTKPKSVERAIRSSIESAWSRGALQRGGWFGAERRPSNGEFLLRLISEVRAQKRGPQSGKPSANASLF